MEFPSMREGLNVLNLPRDKKNESVKRHRDWQKCLDKDDFLNEVILLTFLHFRKTKRRLIGA